MHTKGLFLIFILAISLQNFAQDLLIKNTEGTVLNGTTVYVHADNSLNFDSAVEELVVTNNTSGSLDVKLVKEYVDILEGTSNSFCWGESGGGCVAPFVMESNDQAIAAGAVFEGCSLHYNCMGIEGQSTIKYKFISGVIEEFFTIIFTTETVGIFNDEVSFKIDIFPNPVTGYLNIKHDGDAYIHVFNILGENIVQVKHHNYTRLNCEAWKNGIYFIKCIDANGYSNTYKVKVQN